MPEVILFPTAITLPETNIAHENPIFPGKYHRNGGFSMAMLVSGSVNVVVLAIIRYHDQGPPVSTAGSALPNSIRTYP